MFSNFYIKYLVHVIHFFLLLFFNSFVQSKKVKLHCNTDLKICLCLWSDISVPGPPVRLWFPDVTSNTVKIMWSPPLEPNGIITGYMVSYRRDDTSFVYNSSVIVASQLEYHFSSLENNKYYSFSVRAKTRRGWGIGAKAKVYTTVNRRKYWYNDEE